MSRLSDIEPRALELLRASQALAGIEIVGFARGDPLAELEAALARMQLGILCFLERGRRSLPANRGPVLLDALLSVQVAFRPALLDASGPKPLDLVEGVIEALHELPISGTAATRNAACFTLTEDGFQLLPVDGDDSAFTYNLTFSITLRPAPNPTQST